jgi:hypothetical protein
MQPLSDAQTTSAIFQQGEWPAVAVALINMIGSVLMAGMREKTNQARQESEGGHVRKLLARRPTRKPKSKATS